jgi:type IX secretion system PorP/SprF family membrane protein
MSGRCCTYRIMVWAWVLMGIGVAQHAQGQQEWSYTQYLFNFYDINSAYAGNHGAGSFGVRYRSQWIGMAGSPETQYISYHTPAFQNRIGWGIKLVTENIGARNQSMAKGSAAYKLHMDKGSLSFGIAAGILRQSIDVKSLKVADPHDAQLAYLGERTLTPLVDVSVFYHTKRFYAGLESTRINRTRFNHHENSLARLYYNLVGMVGYMHPIKQGHILQFSSVVRLAEGKTWQPEWNVLYLLKNRCWFGGGYRLNSNAHVIACYNFTEQLRIGMSYDIALNTLRSFNDGSAEVFLGFNFKAKSGKSIRYF